METDSPTSESNGLLPRVVAALALLVTLALVLADAVAPRSLAIVDEGQWLFYGDAIDDGKILYRDVWYQFGPLLLYPLVVAWGLFGKTLLVARAYFFAVNVLGLLIAGLALKRFTRSWLWTALGMLFLEANAFICRAVMINPAFLMRQCFPLLGLVAVAMALERRRGPALFGAGLLGGVGVLVAQATGLFGLFAAGVAALTRSIKAAAWVAAGALLAGLSWCTVAFAQGALGDYIRCSFLDTLTMVGDHQHIPLPTVQALVHPEPKPSSFLDGESTAFTGLLPDQSWFLLTWLPFFLYAWGGLAAWRRLRAGGGVALLLLTLFAAASWTVNLGRSDRYHAAFAAGAAIVLGAALVAGTGVAARRTGVRRLAAAAARAAGVVVVAVLGLSGYDSVRVLVRSAFEPGHFSSDFPRSGGAAIPAEQAARFREICAVVAEEAAPGDGLYVLPHDPAFFFFTQLENPTRFACPIFANQDEYRDEIAADLAADPPQLLITDERKYPGIDYEFYLEKLYAILTGYKIVDRHETTYVQRQR